MTYRNKTYIAGDWTEDKYYIDKIYDWNNSEYWGLNFYDAHELMQSYDTSKPCNVKKSLAQRLNASKTFVLIVGKYTKDLRKGSCRWCSSYDSYHRSCHKSGNVDYRSFIDYECCKAVNDDLKIIVIYNTSYVNKDRCPDLLKNIGTHISFYYVGDDGKWHLNYKKIKDAIMH